jgi:hypothetical protein
MVSKKRCCNCNKKVGLLGFKCRCLNENNEPNEFCSNCRAQNFNIGDKTGHNCTFDYKQMGRILLAKNNPLIQTVKVESI